MKGIGLPVLKRILSRQSINRFGTEYDPSTHATREEAPSISRPTIIYSILLDRDVHCMGLPEVDAVILAFHRPDLVDLHEQRMLHTGPAHNPLFGFPGYVDSELLPVRGTLHVAERLNCRQWHPRLTVTHPDTGEKAPVAFPYQGDLLLFIRVGNKIRMVNWPIKKRRADFRTPPVAAKKNELRVKRKLHRRLIIESTYYDDIAVQEDIDQTLIANLKTAYAYACRESTIDPHIEAAVLKVYQSAVRNRERTSNVLAALAQDGLCTIAEGKELFFRSIWDRRLRVDLFSNVILDAPLKPEVRDVFQEYKHLFPGCPVPASSCSQAN